MKSIKILMAAWLLLSSDLSYADIKNVITESVKIEGLCAKCKRGIESAAFQKNLSKANWNSETKIASISYDSKRASLDVILKRIALAGYDNQSYLAPDDAYNKLEGCCRYERTAKGGLLIPVRASEHEHEAHKTVNQSVTAAIADQLAPVLAAYYGVKDALVSSDGASAASNAAILVKALNSVKMNKLGQEEHTVWTKVVKDLSFDAEHIAETKDVGHQRDHFSSLSDNLYKLIKAGKPSQTIYYQHCPMAKDGKGANWLSQMSTIKNPYYGAQMLSCGKTAETIK